MGNQDVNICSVQVYNNRPIVSNPVVQEFIFQVDTSLGNGLNSFVLNPQTSGTVDYLVDHGDGNETQVNAGGSVVINYASAGIYELKISIVSGFLKPNFFTSVDKVKITDIINWGIWEFSNMTSFLYECSSLTNLSATDYPSFSGTTIQTMIYDCSELVSMNIGSWDISNANSLIQCFRQSPKFNDPTINNLNVTGITNMAQVFWSSTLFDQSLSNWDMSSVTTFDDGLRSTAFSNANYWDTLIGWTGWNGTTATKTLQNNVTAHFGTAQYEIGGESEDVRNYLINTLGWTITDGGGV